EQAVEREMQTRVPVAFVLTDGPPRLRQRASKVGFLGDDVGGAVTQALGLDEDDLGIVGKQIEQNVLAIDEPRQPRLHAVEGQPFGERSEEHTSELQSHLNLVCRLLLEKNHCCDEAIMSGTKITRSTPA